MIKLKKRKVVIGSIVFVVLFVGALIGYNKMSFGKESASLTKSTASVIKGNIRVEISGSGVIEPIKRYDITPLVNGNIISSPYEEGDKVRKGDIIYRFDATEIQGNIQKAKNALQRISLKDKSTKENISESTIYAGTNGILTNFNLKINDNVVSSKVGDIVDNSYILAKVPFTEAEIRHLKIGQSAIVTSQAYMSSVKGIVSKINYSPNVQIYGVKMYDVEIRIIDKNNFADGNEVSAEIGNIESFSTGKIELPKSCSVVPALSGRVSKIYVSNNDYVIKGQKLFELDNEAYVNALKENGLDNNDALINLESLQKQLEDYNIKSPIDGTVIKKNYKEGDTINSGASATNLMVIADLSKVVFDMKIDELDINKMRIGQLVNVTADAIPDKVFVGQITSISNEGTSVNGVSNYLVEVTINNPQELKSGMNVNAKTLVAQRENVLLLPTSAVERRDGKSYVKLITDEKGNQKEVNIETGINNIDYIEVIKGLKEGDKVAIPDMSEEGSPQK